MKKKLLLLTLLLCSLSLVSSAGEFYKTKKKKKSGGDAVEEGKMLIDAYYGYNSLITIFLRAYANDINTTTAANVSGSGYAPDLKYSTTGVLGGRFEYLLTDHIGLSASVMYEKQKLSYTVIDDNSAYTETLEFTRLGLLAGLNVHFLTQEHLDPYALFGLGYMNYNAKYTTTGVSGDTPDHYNIPFPFSARIALGARYFFTDNIGIRLEAGIGSGGILEGGLALKF